MENQIASLEEQERQAAEGDAAAQFALAIRHTHGQGVKADYQQAVRWFHAAADQGHPGAQDSLGVRYATGQGVPKDERMAALCFRMAAERGYPVAQFNLGLAYIHGTGVPADHGEAYAWFALAAAQGDEIAIQTREQLAETLDAAQLRAGKVLYHQRHRQLHPPGQ